MLGPYRTILATPGAKRFSGAGFIGRLPISMIGIGIILMVQGTYGSYGLGGGVSAAYIIAQAICSPQLARLVDRYGQARIMRPAWALATVGLAGLIAAGLTRAPVVLLYAAAIVGGAAIGSIGSLVRARWTYVIKDPTSLHTAYSLESVIDEFIFVVGPVVATMLATSVNPTAALWIPVALVPLGGFLFLAQRSSEPRRTTPVVAGHGPSVMRIGAMWVVSAVFVAMGAIFGTTDISVVAFAEEHGAKSAAGLLLSVFALGSMLAGLVYGARHWVRPLWQRFCLGGVLLALGCALFQVATSFVVLGLIMFVVGGSIAPTIINGNALVQQLVPPQRLTEGLAWAGTFMGVGTSAGSWLAGIVVDAHGSHGGFLAVLGTGVFGIAAIACGIPALRTAAARRELPGPSPAPA